MEWIFLISGLFLGWSLGANDGANIFGTAVGTRMVRFSTAALVSTIFVILGAVLSGAGTTETLGQLGAVNALAGSFTVALMAGFTVTVMTRMKLPVSTSQAVVGAILGWNLFTGSPTDYKALAEIVGTWIFSPILAGIFAIGLYLLAKKYLGSAKIHMLQMDAWTRMGLIVVGAFGAYSLGANNIANVMGMFVFANPFETVTIGGLLDFTSTQQLFLIGSAAIGVGIYTYSYRVMTTVGNDIFKLTPLLALIVVLAKSLVLFVFASQGIERFLLSIGLPALPLVPVSSSQAIIGAILGVAIAKGRTGINYAVVGRIASGWVITPVIAAALCFVALFFVQNVFEQEVVKKQGIDLQTSVLQEKAEWRPVPENTFVIEHAGMNDKKEIRCSTGFPRSIKEFQHKNGTGERPLVLSSIKRSPLTTGVSPADEFADSGSYNTINK
ncbi:inorganic phosphate transporter [Natronogracilivirga saccharolytica]|uniref:Phosphate transporter n=1 Tax=Natronogracilivirga saccharolytica TaxID=2812953 RepID=A0A8J7UTH6_9BACT|nr:inorganic phosphate transporter [Natronogracilivirga saccharolytica]MBP3191345.1 inorganic phosphate transporter [Natronogracilivirga saccharolytica]